jgi:hypothetical protein
MINAMYEMEVIAAGANSGAIPDLGQLSPEVLAELALIISKSARYRKLSAATLMPLWGAICSVKFSFLALFKRFLRQMSIMTRYWWFALAFNIIISLYGGSVFFVACPDFEEKDMMKSSRYNPLTCELRITNSQYLVQCVMGAGLVTTMNHSIAQMSLDVAGDLLSK